jgi:hypothetical protein
MTQKRALFRIALDRKGELRVDGTAIPCEVLDLTEKGVRLRTDLPVQAGDRLQLHFHLTAACPLTCTVQVARVTPPWVGATIDDISPENKEKLTRFIEELNALHMTGF